MKPAEFCLLLPALFMLAGCQNKGTETSRADKAMEEVARLYEKALEQSPDAAVEWAKEDIQRAGDWEYRVVALPDADTGRIEERLNELGEDRWQVFWMQPHTDGLRVFLKRPAKSYLRSIPLSELGKIVSGESN